MSSATSGFFFCGMMDEPVAKASENSTNPNSLVAHRVRSAARREQVHAEDGGRGEELDQEVPIAHRVHAVGAGSVEPQIAREGLAVDGEGGAREGGGAERQHVVPRAAQSASARGRAGA